jgi:hypothetical protein
VSASDPPEDAQICIGVQAKAEALAPELSASDTAEPIEAEASHILVDTEEEAADLRERLRMTGDRPSVFAEIARDTSRCVGSARIGGSLGTVRRGTLAEEFEDVVFGFGRGTGTDVGAVLGPFQTDSGWHLARVTSRSDLVQCAGPSGRFEATIRVDFSSTAPDGFVQALVCKAQDKDPLVALVEREGRVVISVMTPSCIWRTDVGPAPAV